MRFRHFLSAALFLCAYSPNTAEPQTSHPLSWYRCNTHTHSSAFAGSDSNGSPEFIADWYRSHGYQCVVITDHEHLTDVTSLNRKYGPDSNFLALKGEEISQTVFDSAQPGSVLLAHVNGINIDKLILPLGYPNTPRDVSLSKSYERNAAAILAAGGIIQVNHPNVQWSIHRRDLVAIPNPFLLEIWNSYRVSNNLGGSDDKAQIGESPEQLWDELLSNGQVVWGVASDDAHEYSQFDDPESPTPGKAWIVAQAASLSVASITDALRNGHFYASTGIALDTYMADENGISVQLRPASAARYTTRFIGVNGQVLAQVSGASLSYKFRGDEQYVRASIIDSNDHRAWTQPVFLGGRAKLQAPVLQGVHNFRDIGGYTTVDGRKIRHGILYRSADLADMTPTDRAKLAALGIRYEIDLRGSNEIALRPSRWGANRPRISTPFPILFDPNAPHVSDKSPAGDYADLASEQAANIGAVLKELAQTDAPTLLHCAAGNDRTGVTIAVLMTVLGVPRDQVLHEYLRSNEYWTTPQGRVDMRVRAHMSEAAIRAWAGLTADTLEGMFQVLEHRYNSFDGYTRDALKLKPDDVEQLRARFLQK